MLRHMRDHLSLAALDIHPSEHQRPTRRRIRNGPGNVRSKVMARLAPGMDALDRIHEHPRLRRSTLTNNCLKGLTIEWQKPELDARQPLHNSRSVESA